ncbi:MAG: tRNA dihydrouridine synthase DusB [Ndongobacter sp.]|nr:tRNA dihydrouridine synthase DusB [Ndongobacter sp.]
MNKFSRFAAFMQGTAAEKAEGKKASAATDAFFVGLSPLAGVSDVAFRTLCAEQGCDFAVTEMVSAKGLYYNDLRSEKLLETNAQEGAVGCQLFGSEPEILAAVIRNRINPRADLQWIDFNMGCPAPKITKNGEGSALMKNPLLAGKLFRSMVQAANKPVSVKFRLGWDEDARNYVEIGRIAQEEGVSFVTLHGRTTRQMYSGRADWTAIAQLVDAVQIPVIGNGDVTTPEDALRMVRETGCSGVAIGRGAMGNPFLFRQIRQLRDTGAWTPATLAERFAVLERHYRTELSVKGERIALLEMRKHTGWYLSGLPGSARVKQEINRTMDQKSVFDLLHAYRQELADREAASGEIR